MKAADLREKSMDELVALEKELAHDVFQNRLKNFTNRLDDTSAIRKTKRDLARVITLVHERALVATAAASAVEAKSEPKGADRATGAAAKVTKKGSIESEAKS